MKLQIRDRGRKYLGSNVYATTEDGSVYVGRKEGTDVKWIKYPRADAPRTLFEWAVTRVIDADVK